MKSWIFGLGFTLGWFMGMAWGVYLGCLDQIRRARRLAEDVDEDKEVAPE